MRRTKSKTNLLDSKKNILIALSNLNNILNR